MGDKMAKKNETKQLILEKIKILNRNNFKTIEVLFLIIVTAIVGIIIGYLINNVKDKTINDDLQEIIDNYNYIMDQYYDVVDSDEVVDGAINGMLTALGDDYSSLLKKDDNSSFYTSLQGSYDGIGVGIYNNEENNIVVVGVLDNSPAQASGIEAGDIIKEVDGKSFINTNIKELTNYIKNNNPKEFNIVVIRDGSEQTIKVPKSNIIIKSVLSKTFEKDNHKIGYIYISIFSNTTSSQFKKALDDLEKQNIDSLIVDVRGNGGGHLLTVTTILSTLMDSNHVIYQIEKDNKKTKYYSFGKETKTYPIVVLQNEDSASASELFSAALKESYGAKIVGGTSYGKGTVQELVNLSSGDSYKFTTKKWLTPNGEWINEKGIEPDVKVDLDEVYKNNPIDENDNQLKEAINTVIR